VEIGQSLVAFGFTYLLYSWCWWDGNQNSEDADKNGHNYRAVEQDRPATNTLDGKVKRDAAERSKGVKYASDERDKGGFGYAGKDDGA